MKLRNYTGYLTRLYFYFKEPSLFNRESRVADLSERDCKFTHF